MKKNYMFKLATKFYAFAKQKDFNLVSDEELKKIPIHGNTLYWMPSLKGDIKPGFTIPDFTVRSPYIEKVFEKVRQ